MHKLLVILIFMTTIICQVQAQDFPMEGSFFCQMTYLDENQHIISSYKKKTHLQFDGEDQYWFGRIEIKEHHAEVEYHHTVPGTVSYSGETRISTKNPETKKISMSRATVSLGALLEHQIPIKEFKIETRTAHYIKIACNFED